MMVTDVPPKTPMPTAHESTCHTKHCWERLHRKRVIISVEKKIERVAPYRCATDTITVRSAVPCFIIDHESRHVRPNPWFAVNSNGCITEYQFCGWNVPWPVWVSNRYVRLKRMLAAHRMARKLWDEQESGRACNWCY